MILWQKHHLSKEQAGCSTVALRLCDHIWSQREALWLTSRPMATKAEIGNHTAIALPPRVCAAVACHTARHTSQLHRIPLPKACSNQDNADDLLTCWTILTCQRFVWHGNHACSSELGINCRQPYTVARVAQNNCSEAERAGGHRQAQQSARMPQRMCGRSCRLQSPLGHLVPQPRHRPWTQCPPASELPPCCLHTHCLFWLCTAAGPALDPSICMTFATCLPVTPQPHSILCACSWFDWAHQCRRSTSCAQAGQAWHGPRISPLAALQCCW